MWDTSDEALLAGYATGDAEAALVFVRRFQARVYGLALSITRDPVDAEEVAQDAFLRAWRYAASFDARRGTVTGWLMGITRNVALDRVRIARHGQDRVALDHPDGSWWDRSLWAGDDIYTEDLVQVRDEAERVVRAMGRLPQEQRRALLAVTLGGMTAQEFATATDIPLGTAKTRIRLGLRKLRGLLEVHVA